MERGLSGKRPTFHREQRGTSFYRIMTLLGLIVGAVWLLMMVQRREVISPFEPTPTPTRVAESYFLEAQAYFDAGVLDNPSTPTAAADERASPVINDAIDAYKAALAADPEKRAPGPNWHAFRLIHRACCATIPSG
ncbi:MAG: hypothetical protein M5U05_08645 [Anaerolineales bacterium]|nr:hypothetical protein [Anaerolineales bacterium]